MDLNRIFTVASAACLMFVGAVTAGSIQVPGIVACLVGIAGIICARLAQTPLKGYPRLKIVLTVLTVATVTIAGVDAATSMLPKWAILVAAIVGTAMSKLTDAPAALAPKPQGPPPELPPSPPAPAM